MNLKHLFFFLFFGFFSVLAIHKILMSLRRYLLKNAEITSNLSRVNCSLP